MFVNKNVDVRALQKKKKWYNSNRDMQTFSYIRAFQFYKEVE